MPQLSSQAERHKPQKPHGQKDISIVIPVKNEGNSLEGFLNDLQKLRADAELIVVDGESNDDTVKISAPLVDKVIKTSSGRSLQMNAGAKAANGEILLFLHADTQLPANALSSIKKALKDKKWGRFNVKLSSSHFMFRVIETFMNIRSKYTHINTGDQAIFINKALFNQVGQFDDIPLMEDVALCKKLKAKHKPACLKSKVITSSRRWEKNGIFKTIMLMWKLRLAYYLGTPAEKLAAIYYPSSKSNN